MSLCHHFVRRCQLSSFLNSEKSGQDIGMGQIRIGQFRTEIRTGHIRTGRDYISICIIDPEKRLAMLGLAECLALGSRAQRQVHMVLRKQSPNDV